MVGYNKDTIFILGGWIPGAFTTNRVERYDYKGKEWYSVNGMQENRAEAAAVTLNNSIYVFGGISKGSHPHTTSDCYTRTSECYDVITNDWKYCAPIPINPLAGAQAVAIDSNTIAVMGGLFCGFLMIR